MAQQKLNHAAAAVKSGEWMRLPTKGRDPLFGLTRSHYYNLIASGAIKSSCIRRPGTLTGVRLVNVQSVRDYIERNIETVEEV